MNYQHLYGKEKHEFMPAGVIEIERIIRNIHIEQLVKQRDMLLMYEYSVATAARIDDIERLIAFWRDV